MPKVVLDFQLGTIYMVNQQLTHPSVGLPPVLTPLSLGLSPPYIPRVKISITYNIKLVSPTVKFVISVEKRD